jgi:adenylate cyclase
MGDEIMVIWGAPVAHDDDPARAIRAALEIQSSLAEFNKARAEQGMRCVELGIGINTGNIVAGYIGSSKTMSYSVIGDIVNVAHGICSSAQGGQIVISENTHAYVQDLCDVASLDAIHTKGKLEATPVYEVIGEERAHQKSVSAY